MVVAKYWERKRQYDDTAVDNEYEDKIYLNPRAPHEQSLCERCMELGRPCW